MPRFVSRVLPVLAMAVLVAGPVAAEDSAFKNGTVFESFGQFAPLEVDMTIPKRSKFAVAFDTKTAGEVGEVSKSLNTAARFMNMHVDAGVRKKDIRLAVVVHSKAAFDLTIDEYYSGKYDGAKNPNAEVIKALTGEGVRIILCGQTAAYYGVNKDDLLPGVEMALSAMTAHALLQQGGYSLNPF